MRRSSHQTTKLPSRGDDSQRFFRFGHRKKQQEQLPRSAVALKRKKEMFFSFQQDTTLFAIVALIFVLIMACTNLYVLTGMMSTSITTTATASSLATTTTTAPSPLPPISSSMHSSNSSRMCQYLLTAGSKLAIGEVICSTDGRYQFGLAAENGDLVMWNDDNDSEQKTIIWFIPLYSRHSSRTPQNTTLTMVGGGNVVVRDNASSKKKLFESGTGGSEGSTLHVTDNGSVRIIAKDQHQVLWDSHVQYFCNRTARTSTSPSTHNDLIPVNADTLHHKVMAGYQGWFRTECDGNGSKWKHWTKFNIPPNVNHSAFDMWPDLSEWNNTNSSEVVTCPTGFHFKNGANAPLFGSLVDGVIRTHVKWMYEYGIDGVFVQRFVTQLNSHRCQEDEKLDQIRRHSEQYGRVFVNMYDISGGHPDSVYGMIKNDWIHLVDHVTILESDRYLRHNGKPVLAIWGFGFKDRVNNPEKVAELIDWFQNKAPAKYQVTLMGGVPGFWRTLGRDSLKDEAWASVYRSFDIISPWNVGRYASNNGVDKHLRDEIEPDILECETHGIDYFPVVFPGYSFSHRNAKRRFNQIPRLGGKFLWRQMYNAIHAGSKQVYVAMFDEVDEGTAIFKTAATSAQAPDQGKWLTLDADGCNVPSDWYLQLVGNATTMLRETGSVPKTIPALQELQCN
eukprot:CAMPEP_0198281462 /NCGR_PEP_ID=MMETSP1449-20131203/1388_1 /TAXON_ID=420275 /ORGANISM="Attheya septentrionalis, Strain CCMP2084" /LENGTH=675 /DNA_ID=CAMNT_0043977233 /DNA_START=77 /DNA_END=2104 /DNA_ORIENTATION=+